MTTKKKENPKAGAKGETPPVKSITDGIQAPPPDILDNVPPPEKPNPPKEKPVIKEKVIEKPVSGILTISGTLSSPSIKGGQVSIKKQIEVPIMEYYDLMEKLDAIGIAFKKKH